jgi:hypothetical protein
VKNCGGYREQDRNPHDDSKRRSPSTWHRGWRDYVLMPSGVLRYTYNKTWATGSELVASRVVQPDRVESVDSVVGAEPLQMGPRRVSG